MPEATVDEDGDLGSGKDDVGLSSDGWFKATVYPKTEAVPV
jgi:hypothetical protein